MWMHFRISFVMLVLLTAITGLAYPLLVTGIAQVALPHAANGSLIVRDGKVAGSSLVGQQFTDPKYFWGRPSATSPYPNNSGASSGSNQGPTNPALTEAVAGRIKALQEADPASKASVPVDLVTASASGFDPHISPAAAAYQVNRVAKARGIDPAKVRALVADWTEGRELGFLGEPRVNVLRLNLALDGVARSAPTR